MVSNVTGLGWRQGWEETKERGCGGSGYRLGLLRPWAISPGSHPALKTREVISRAVPRSALVQFPYIFLTACPEGYEILRSVPDPGIDNKVPTPCCLPPKLAARTPSCLPPKPCPPILFG